MAQIETPLPKGKTDIKAVAAQIAAPERSGDYSQALMDLGATVCTPRNPSCHICVWAHACGAHRTGEEEAYPKKRKKKPLPKRRGVVFVLRSADNYVLLRQRPDTGLLGGMMDFPGSEWGKGILDDPIAAAPLKANWRLAPQQVVHAVSYTHLTLPTILLV